MAKSISQMTRLDFEALPEFPANTTIICSSIVGVPTRKIHESGFRIINIVPCTKDGPLGIIRRNIDSIEFKDDKHIANWEMDVLPVSGLVRMWPNANMAINNEGTSTLHIRIVP